MASRKPTAQSSIIRDNYYYGRVGDFLKATLRPGASLSIVSAYFTIYAYEALREQLATISELRFLFGEPRFVKSVDPGSDESRAFQITDQGLQIRRQLLTARCMLCTG